MQWGRAITRSQWWFLALLYAIGFAMCISAKYWELLCYWAIIVPVSVLIAKGVTTAISSDPFEIRSISKIQGGYRIDIFPPIRAKKIRVVLENFTRLRWFPESGCSTLLIAGDDPAECVVYLDNALRDAVPGYEGIVVKEKALRMLRTLKKLSDEKKLL